LFFFFFFFFFSSFLKDQLPLVVWRADVGTCHFLPMSFVFSLVVVSLILARRDWLQEGSGGRKERGRKEGKEG